MADWDVKMCTWLLLQLTTLSTQIQHKLTNPQFEAVKRVCVDCLQFAHQSDGKLHHGAHMTVGHLHFLQGEPEIMFKLSRLSYLWYRTSFCFQNILSILFKNRQKHSDPWKSEQTFLSSPGAGCVNPAAAMYVLPMVLIFSTEENLGLERSCMTEIPSDWSLCVIN